MTRLPLVLTPQHFGALLFDRRTSRYLPFDMECSEILDALCEADVDAVARHHAAPDLLYAFAERLWERGFLTPDGRLAAHRLQVSPPEDHLVGPLALHLEIIAACNLSCSHCFAGPLPRKGAPLSVMEMETLFAQLAGMGCFRLGLTGGEPLMRRDLFDILDAATGHGLHPCLTTNGLFITEEIARRFAQRELVWLNVSLEGACAETNDAVRGAGTFDRVLDKLKILSRHTRFTLAFTLTSDNLDEIEQCADLARRVGAHTAVFRPVYPAGTARDNLHLLPAYEDYAAALARLEGALVCDEELGGIDPFSPQHRQPGLARVHTNAGCGAGNTVCSISAHGDVNPCSFLGAQHDAGNIRQRPFPDIWHDSAGFTAIRSLPGEEAGCFSGGCRARSQALAGSINAPDPWQEAWAAQQERIAPSLNLEVVR